MIGCKIFKIKRVLLKGDERLCTNKVKNKLKRKRKIGLLAFMALVTTRNMKRRRIIAYNNLGNLVIFFLLCI
jgi:hypothetical protein